MYYINAKLNIYNSRWFFNYLVKNFKNENVSLYLDVNTKFVLKETIHNILKILRRTNINFIKLNLNEKTISSNMLKRLNMFCRKGPLAVFELNSYDDKKLKLINNTSLPFIIKSSENKKYEKILFYNDERLLNLLMFKFKMPSLCCSYSSCLGKTVFIKNKKMSICKNIEFKKEIINTNNILEFVVNSSFTSEELKKVINKREECKKNCELYSACKSGCPGKINDCIKELFNNKIILNYKTNLYFEMFLRNAILNGNNTRDDKDEK